MTSEGIHSFRRQLALHRHLDGTHFFNIMNHHAFNFDSINIVFIL